MFLRLKSIVPKRWRFFNEKSVVFGALAAFVLIGALVLYFLSFGWWRIKLDGEMYSSLILDGRYLYAGDNAGILRSWNRFSGKVVWKNDFQSEVYKLVINGRRLVVMSGDTIFVLDKKNGDELWRYSTDSSFGISDFVISRSTIIAFDSYGNVSALSLTDGKLLWSRKVDSKPEKVSSLFSSLRGLRWGTLYILHDDDIIYSPPGGSLYSQNVRTGKVNWMTISPDLITSISKTSKGKNILVGRKSGLLETISLKEASKIEMRHYDDSIECVGDFAEADIQVIEIINMMKYILPGSRFLHEVANEYKSEGMSLFPSVGRNVQVIIFGNGKIIGRLNDAEWTLQLPKVVGCPLEWYGRAFVRANNGSISAIDVLKGEILWENKIANKPINFFDYYFSSLKRTIFSELTTYNRWNDPDLLLSNDEGSWLLRSSNGSLRWANNQILNITSAAYSHGELSYYLASSKGQIDKINALTGNYFVVEKKDFEISSKVIQYGRVPMLEITINHDDENYVNPFLDVRILARFSQNDKAVDVRAFYYDKDTWKIRFVPDATGEWHYSIDFFSQLDSFSSIGKGVYSAENSSDGAYLKVNEEFPQWLTLDGKTIWNGVGVQDYPSDRNQNGNFLDDFSLGVDTHNEFEATTSAGLTVDLGNDLYVPMSRYLDTSTRDGGIAIYRWNFDFPKYSLMGPDIRDLKIDLQKAREVDTFFSELKSREIAVWATLFNFRLPFSDPSEEKMKGERYMQPLVEYVIARFGAFVDIWELSNEAHSPDLYIQKILSLFRNSDYQSKLLTTSWEKPKIKGFDIVAPHWYDSEHIPQSDVVTVNTILPLLKYNQPIVFGEQGNLTVNYDVLSADRMRIRLWTAFFNKALLVFWNSSADVYKAPSDKFSNINIGETERKYISIFRMLTKDTELSAEMAKPVLTGCGEIRGYGLKTSKEWLFYLVKPLPKYNYDDCRLTVSPNKPADTILFDTSSGEVVDQFTSSTMNSIKIPDFYPDLFVKVSLSESIIEK